MSDESLHGSVTIRADGDELELETVENVADVAEVTPGRLQVVFTDETSEFRSGSLFGGWGEWRMWLDHPRNDGMEQHTAEDPMTTPGDFIRFYPEYGTRDRAATIKRLKRPDL